MDEIERVLEKEISSLFDFEGPSKKRIQTREVTEK